MCTLSCSVPSQTPRPLTHTTCFPFVWLGSAAWCLTSLVLPLIESPFGQEVKHSRSVARTESFLLRWTWVTENLQMDPHHILMDFIRWESLPRLMCDCLISHLSSAPPGPGSPLPEGHLRPGQSALLLSGDPGWGHAPPAAPALGAAAGLPGSGHTAAQQHVQPTARPTGAQRSAGGPGPMRDATTTTTVTTTQTRDLCIYWRASSIRPGPKTVITPFCAILMQLKSLVKYYWSEVKSLFHAECTSCKPSRCVMPSSLFTVPVRHILVWNTTVQTCYQSCMQ